jgi:hypothetical protein
MNKRIGIGTKNDISGKEKEIDALLEKFPKIGIADLKTVYTMFPYHKFTMGKRIEVLSHF